MQTVQPQAAHSAEQVLGLVYLYENAMSSRLKGNRIANPAQPGTLEHAVWERGYERGRQIWDDQLNEALVAQTPMQHFG